VDMLVAWHLGDPVSAKELDRNEAVYAIQANRNPFIDHPEFVLMIWSPTGVEDGLPPMAAALAVSPNPFSSCATISFELAEPQVVDLEFFDLGGRLVQDLMDDNPLPAGNCETTWTGTDASGAQLANGVYFCRLSTPDGASTCQVLLLR